MRPPFQCTSGRTYNSPPPVHLLISVRTADEAALALAGGADIVDAKEPARGALGPVAPSVFRAICDAVAGRRPVTAALGDAADEEQVERDACAYAGMGAELVKIGFAGVGDRKRVAALVGAASRGARVVAVAYADFDRAGSARPDDVLDSAARGGACGVLLDTADKAGPGLLGLMPVERLRPWVVRAHEMGLFAAVAGRLTLGCLPLLAALGADVVGFRGAACTGGREGRLSPGSIRRLRDQIRAAGRSGDGAASSRSTGTTMAVTPAGQARSK